MINKIQRKLSVKRFANGGIGLIAPPNERLMLPPGTGAPTSAPIGVGSAAGARVPASPYTMKGFSQAAMSAWPKIKNVGSLGFNTPAGRVLWLASLGIPWVANQTRKTADKIGETETISVNVSGIPRAIDIPVDSPALVKENAEQQTVTDLDQSFSRNE